jgi:phage gpG-like protein
VGRVELSPIQASSYIMAKGFNIEVSDRAINNILKKYKTLVNDAAVEIDMELAAHGEDMARSAKNLAPGDNDEINSTKGRLKGSISLAKKEFMSYELVAEVNYAAYHEFGTGANYEVPEYKEWEEIAEKFKGKGLRQVNIMPRPFMRPSILAYWPKFKTRVIEVLKMYK